MNTTIDSVLSSYSSHKCTLDLAIDVHWRSYIKFPFVVLSTWSPTLGTKDGHIRYNFIFWKWMPETVFKAVPARPAFYRLIFVVVVFCSPVLVILSEMFCLSSFLLKHTSPVKSCQILSKSVKSCQILSNPVKSY